MKLIENKIICDKTIQLIRKSLIAGYRDPKTNKVVRTKVGTPQGSVLSPLLSNIVLHELDKYMTKLKLREETSPKRLINKEYNKITSQIQRLQLTEPGSPEIRKLAIKRRRIPSLVGNDPLFKRILYLRYADDFVILIIGSKHFAIAIKK